MSRCTRFRCRARVRSRLRETAMGMMTTRFIAVSVRWRRWSGSHRWIEPKQHGATDLADEARVRRADMTWAPRPTATLSVTVLATDRHFLRFHCKKCRLRYLMQWERPPAG